MWKLSDNLEELRGSCRVCNSKVVNANMLEVFGLLIAARTKKMPPINVCINKAMGHHLQTLANVQRKGHGMCYPPLKHNATSWLLCVVGFVGRHYNNTLLQRESTGFLFGLTNLPKENSPCLVAMWLTLPQLYLTYYGMGILLWFYYVMYDASPSLKLAHDEVMRRVKHCC